MRRIERMLSHTAPQSIDNTRIKNLVREKIMREKMRRKVVMRRRISLGFAAAACLALIVTLGMRFMSPDSLDISKASIAEVKAASYIEMAVGHGEISELILPDGSRLIANSNSRILYPEEFSGNERRIYIHGEVYLQVAKDREHPFVVESDGFDVKVLGTTFNITNTGKSTASVVLVEGSVEITTDSNRTARMRPNDKVDLSDGEIVSMTKVDPSEYTAWTKGLMALHGERLDAILQRLSDRYDVHIVCDESLAGTKVYGKLDLRDSVEQVLDYIRQITPMEITRQNNSIVLRGTPK